MTPPRVRKPRRSVLLNGHDMFHIGVTEDRRPDYWEFYAHCALNTSTQCSRLLRWLDRLRPWLVQRIEDLEEKEKTR